MRKHDETVPRQAGSQYEVHWMLTVPQGQAERYGKIIRHAWWTYGGIAGERRLTCDYAGSTVVAAIRLVSDDPTQAINVTRDQVIRPLERIGLSLPTTLVVIVSKGGEPGAGLNNP